MAENKIGYKYNGTIEQFKASDYPTTHADRIVYITGDDYGIGRGVFCGGNYYDAYNPYKVAILPTIATAPTSGYQYSVTACTIDGTASEVYNALVACANAQVPVMIHYTGSNAWRWFMGSCTIPASGQVLLEYWLPSGSHFQIVFTSSGFRNGNCWNIRQGLQNVMDSGSSSGSASKEVVDLGEELDSVTLEAGKSYYVTADSAVNTFRITLDGDWNDGDEYELVAYFFPNSQGYTINAGLVTFGNGFVGGSYTLSDVSGAAQICHMKFVVKKFYSPYQGFVITKAFCTNMEIATEYLA